MSREMAEGRRIERLTFTSPPGSNRIAPLSSTFLMELLERCAPSHNRFAGGCLTILAKEAYGAVIRNRTRIITSQGGYNTTIL